MFIRGILEGKNTSCVTSKLRLKSVRATMPDLDGSIEIESGRWMGTRKGTRNGDILVLATAVYIVITSGDTEYRSVFLGECVY